MIVIVKFAVALFVAFLLKALYIKLIKKEEIKIVDLKTISIGFILGFLLNIKSVFTPFQIFVSIFLCTVNIILSVIGENVQKTELEGEAHNLVKSFAKIIFGLVEFMITIMVIVMIAFSI